VSTGTPGPIHSFVRIYDSTKPHIRKKMIEAGRQVSMPTFYPDDVTEPLPEDIYHEDLFQMSDKTIMYQEESDS
jgi:hypothetical protein